MKLFFLALFVCGFAGVVTADQTKHDRFDLKDSQDKTKPHGATERNKKVHTGYIFSNSKTPALGYKEVLLKISKACMESVPKRLKDTNVKKTRCNKKLIKGLVLRRHKRSHKSKNTKLKDKKNIVMNDLPKPEKPLKIVAASSAIKSRLKGRPPIKAIHIWGTTPFNVFVNRLTRLHKNIQQQRKAIGSMKRLFTPLQSSISHFPGLKEGQSLQNEGSIPHEQEMKVPIIEQQMKVPIIEEQQMKVPIIEEEQMKVPIIEEPETKQEQYVREEKLQQQQEPLTQEISEKPQVVSLGGNSLTSNTAPELSLVQKNNNPVVLSNDSPNLAERLNDGTPVQMDNLPKMPIVQKLNDGSPSFNNGMPNLPMGPMEIVQEPQAPIATGGFPYFARYFGYPPVLGDRSEGYEGPMVPPFFQEDMMNGFHHYGQHKQTGRVFFFLRKKRNAFFTLCRRH